MSDSTPSEYPHLSIDAAKLLLLEKEDRIFRIRSPRWIGYNLSRSVLNKLEELKDSPKSHRMPNLLIVGETNNGKTMLVQRFRNKFLPVDNGSGQCVSVPVLLIQAPPEPDEGRLYNAILEALFAPYRASDRVDKKLYQVLELLKQVGVQLLIIDEIHNMLAGSMNKQRTFHNVLRNLGNALQISIVVVGTVEAHRAISTDDQLANRFEPIEIPLWKDDKEFRQLLVSFERMLPLMKPSRLSSSAMHKKIYSMSEGYIGEVSRILVQASVKAVETGQEFIDVKLLDSLNWYSPSMRRKQLEGFR